MNYYPHHIGDFDRATRHLTRIERSIYRDLLDVYYDTEQQLTLDLNFLSRKILARAPEEMEAMRTVLAEFFHETPAGWYHDRCEAELEAYRKSTSQKSIAGKASAAARATKREQAINGIPTAVVTAVPTAVEQPSNGIPTNQEPGTNNQSKPKPTSSSGDDGDSPVKVKPFEQFWAVYPNKVAKIEAQKAWAALKLDKQVDEIVDAVVNQLEGHDFRNDGGQFIPHPATWLRAGRWLDVVRPWVPPPPKLPAGWWETAEGMRAAGAMLTPPLEPRSGEYPKQFAARIRAALDDAGAPAGPATSGALPLEAYVPPAPPPEVHLTPEQVEERRKEMRAAMTKLKHASPIAGVRPNTDFPTTEGVH